MVGALTSHQCGPGSNPGVDAICGLSLLLVLSLAPSGFSPGTPVFPLSSKTNISKFQFDKESSRRRTILWMYYLQIIILFLYYFLWYETELAENNAPKTSIFERFRSYLTLNCKECLKSDLWLWDGFGKCLLFVLSANGWMIKTWPLRFPAKEKPNMEIGQSCCSMMLKRSIDWILESSSGMKFLQPSIHLTNQKPCMFVTVRYTNQVALFLFVCCFCFVWAFSFKGHTKIALSGLQH